MTPADVSYALFTLFIQEGLIFSYLSRTPSGVRLDAQVAVNQQNVTGSGATFEDAFQALLLARDAKLQEVPAVKGFLELHLSRSTGLLDAYTDNPDLYEDEKLVMTWPERNRHPDEHADVADRLLMLAAEGDHLVVTTHSHGVFLRVMRAVAERRFPTSRLQVTWHDDNGLNLIPVDDNGRATGLPPLLWQGDLVEARGIISARR